MYTSLEQRMAQSYIGLSPSFRSICFRAQGIDWIVVGETQREEREVFGEII